MKLRTLSPTIRFEQKWPDLLAALLHVAVYVLGGMMLARWFWLLFAPAVPVLPVKIEQAVSAQSSVILAAHWFGSSGARPMAMIVAPANFKLTGVYAPNGGKPGFAVFKLADGKQRAVLLHQEITSGIRLLAIKPDGVQVGYEGGGQTILLEDRKAPH